MGFKVKKGLALLMVMVMMTAMLVGCGEMDTYKAEAVKAIDTMGADMTALQDVLTSFDGTDASLKTIVEKVDACKKSCQAIIDLKAPDKAKDAHAKLTTSMTNIMDAMDTFSAAFSSVEKIQAASDDGSLVAAQEKMIEGANQLMEAATDLEALK